MSIMKHRIVPTPEEDAAYEELKANPTGFRWIVHGGKGHSVSAVHPRFPYIAFPICTTNNREISQSIADSHNAAIGEGAANG